MKGTPAIGRLNARDLSFYAQTCGWALARGHARSGDPAAISGYLGNGQAFDKAVTRFAFAYADQTERDYAALIDAAKTGRIEAREGI